MDCSTIPSCGNGTCDFGESIGNCVADCSLCGDHFCSGPESVTDCPQDCSVCGDGLCTGTETIASCVGDCTTCGDGQCTGDETLANCPADCSICGDGMCTGAETAVSCVADCGLASVKVTNMTTYTINVIYVTPCGASPTTNLLTTNLAPNYYVTFQNIPIGCYDLRAQTVSNMTAQLLGTTLTGGAPYNWNLN
jgi:hypothetical protein